MSIDKTVPDRLDQDLGSEPSIRIRRLTQDESALRSISPATIWSPRRRRVTAGLLLAVATGAFESLGVGTVMPAANAEFHDLRHYGLVFSSFMLAQLVGIVVGGWQADRSKPERPYVLGTIVFSLGLLVTGTAPSMLVMAAGRTLQGLGGGAISGLTVYAVRRCYDEGSRPRMLAMMSTAFVVPGLLGPTLAAGINELFGWRWVFLGIVPLMPLAALLAIPVLRLTASTEQGEATAQSRRSAWLLTVAVGFALLALGGSPAWLRIGAALPAAGFGLAGLAAILPAGWSRFRAGQPAAVAFILWGAAGYYSIESFLPLALTSVHHTTIVESGLTLSAGTLLWSVGSWLQARLVKPLGGPVLLALGSPVLLAGIVLTAVLMTSASVPFPLVSLSWAVVTLGMGLTSSTGTLVVLDYATAGTEGRISSAIQVATLLGGAVGTGLASLSVAASGHALTASIRVVGLFASACAVLAVIGTLRARTGPRADR